MGLDIILMILVIADGDIEVLNNWIEVVFGQFQLRAYCK